LQERINAESRMSGTFLTALPLHETREAMSEKDVKLLEIFLSWIA
jgi:hypothetical protein